MDFHADATDAEGDNAADLQVGLRRGRRTRPTTPDASYTYTAPGNYEAMVTVTDSRGAATTEHVPITV